VAASLLQVPGTVIATPSHQEFAIQIISKISPLFLSNCQASKEKQALVRDEIHNW
jgi:hypothetical protein